MSYEADLKIEHDALDIEWLKRPEVAMKYNRLSAEADREVRRLKERLEVIESELVLEMSSQGKDGKKPTAQIISAQVKTHPRYKKLFRLLNEAQYEADILKGAVFAFQQRKSALENLVILHGQNYFAGPSVPRDLSTEKIESMRKERANNKVRERLNRK